MNPPQVAESLYCQFNSAFDNPAATHLAEFVVESDDPLDPIWPRQDLVCERHLAMLLRQVAPPGSSAVARVRHVPERNAEWEAQEAAEARHARAIELGLDERTTD